MPFETGQLYTRKEIAAEFGGMSGGAFPAQDQKVLCCLVDLGSDGVTHLSGEVDLYPKRLGKAAQGISTGDRLPLFLKISTQLWRYAGEYEVKAINSSKARLEEARKEIGREDIAAVFSFTPTTPPLKVVEGRRRT